MQLEHEFTVPVPIDEAWDVLLDVERLAPCMPGAILDEVRGDEFDGRVKVKVGPISVTYKGTAQFLSKDLENRTIKLKAAGKETKAAGTAAATITATMKETGGETRVAVSTDLAITGKPAQFARGVMVDVSNKLLGQFVSCLSDQITSGGGGTGTGQPGTEGTSSANKPPQPLEQLSGQSNGRPPAAERAEPEAIDLMGTAGLPVIKRLLPVAAVAAALLVLVRRVRSR